MEMIIGGGGVGGVGGGWGSGGWVGESGEGLKNFARKVGGRGCLEIMIEYRKKS